MEGLIESSLKRRASPRSSMPPSSATPNASSITKWLRTAPTRAMAGHKKIVDLLQQTLDEEGAADNRN